MALVNLAETCCQSFEPPLQCMKTQKWTLIDIAVPADQDITRMEEEKVEKYQELAFAIRRIHGAL